MNSDISIYSIYIKLWQEEESTLKNWQEIGEKYRKQNLNVEELSDENKIPENLFWGEKSVHLTPIVPFKWEGKLLKIMHNSEHIISHALLFNDIIEVEITKCKGKIENNRLLSISTENEKEQLKMAQLQVIDVEWNKWEDNYPVEIDDNTILSWLLLGANKKLMEFGEMFSYEKAGLWDKEKRRITNLSSLPNCFLNCSNKRLLIIRDPNVKRENITVPGLEIVCWAGIGVIGASRLIEIVDKVEEGLKKLFEAVNKKKNDKDEKDKEKFIISNTSEMLKILGRIYRTGCKIQNFFSTYPLSSPVTSLVIETFTRLSGATGAIKALEQELENAYRLYQLYQQYYYFKEMEKLESVT